MSRGRNKAKELLTGPMEKSMLASGRMVCKVDKEKSFSIKLSILVFGKKG